MGTRTDVMVIGGGAMGTAAARQLALAGRETVLLERFEIGHAKGSSGGPTRIFRLAYHTPDYVRFAMRARESWEELEDAAGEELLRVTGGLDVGHHGRETAEALRAAGAVLEYLHPDEVNERWPALRFPEGDEIFLQPDGGVVQAVRTVEVQARLAAEAGATVRTGVQVTELVPDGDGVEVRTDAGETLQAATVVVTAGGWAGPLLRTAGIDLPLVPSLEQVTYFQLGASALGGREADPLPTVIDWVPDRWRTPYLVPDPFAVEPGHFKVGMHLTGADTDAETRSFDPDPELVASAKAYTAGHITDFRDLDRTDTCLYTNTPDEDFVLDRIGPIVVISPCSGHGFKFVPLMGEVAAALVTGEEPPVPLDPFRADRAALLA